MRYLICYDLVAPGRTYQALYDALGELGGKRVLESQWVLRHSNTNAEALREHFRQYTDANDRLLVICMDARDAWASWNAMVNLNAA